MVRPCEGARGLVPVSGVSRRRPTGASGFTLIELLIVITIIIVLAGIGLATYGNSVARSKEAALKQDLFAMRDAIDQYYADRNKYPASLQDLVSEKYIRMVPVDPFTGSSETWQTVMAEPDARNPTAEIGIYDVKSGATQTSQDGTPYAEW
jgi:general secretion pathway protein G